MQCYSILRQFPCYATDIISGVDCPGPGLKLMYCLNKESLFAEFTTQTLHRFKRNRSGLGNHHVTVNLLGHGFSCTTEIRLTVAQERPRPS